MKIEKCGKENILRKHKKEIQVFFQSQGPATLWWRYYFIIVIIIIIIIIIKIIN